MPDAPACFSHNTELPLLDAVCFSLREASHPTSHSPLPSTSLPPLPQSPLQRDLALPEAPCSHLVQPLPILNYSLTCLLSSQHCFLTPGPLHTLLSLPEPSSHPGQLAARTPFLIGIWIRSSCEFSFREKGCYKIGGMKRGQVCQGWGPQLESDPWLAFLSEC